jgi:hypothetical protein
MNAHIANRKRAFELLTSNKDEDAFLNRFPELADSLFMDIIEDSDESRSSSYELDDESNDLYRSFFCLESCHNCDNSYEHVILVALVICVAENGMARALVLCASEMARRQKGVGFAFRNAAYYMCGAMFEGDAEREKKARGVRLLVRCCPHLIDDVRSGVKVALKREEEYLQQVLAEGSWSDDGPYVPSDAVEAIKAMRLLISDAEQMDEMVGRMQAL